MSTLNIDDLPIEKWEAYIGYTVFSRSPLSNFWSSVEDWILAHCENEFTDKFTKKTLAELISCLKEYEQNIKNNYFNNNPLSAPEGFACLNFNGNEQDLPKVVQIFCHVFLLSCFYEPANPENNPKEIIHKNIMQHLKTKLS